MPDQKVALGLELRQIIQADRMACDIIQNANDMRSAIEARTEQDKKRILDQANQKLKEVTEQVKRDQMQELETRKKETANAFEKEQNTITLTVKENRDRWVNEIVTKITSI